MELGELISFYRRRAGLTIDELAEKSGVPKSTINKIIGGTTKAPTLENVKAIAKALGVRLSDFDNEPELADMFSVIEQNIIKKYRSLDLHGKEAVDAVLEVEYKRYLENKSQMEAAEEIAQTPVTWDELDDREKQVIEYFRCLKPGQRDMFLDQTLRLKEREKASLSAASLPKTDEKPQ